MVESSNKGDFATCCNGNNNPKQQLKYRHIWECQLTEQVESTSFDECTPGPKFCVTYNGISLFFRFNLYRNGGSSGGRNYEDKIMIYLKYVDGPLERVTLNSHRMYVIDRHGKEVNERKTDVEKLFRKNADAWGWGGFLSKDKQKLVEYGILQHDQRTLILCAEMELVTDVFDHYQMVGSIRLADHPLAEHLMDAALRTTQDAPLANEFILVSGVNGKRYKVLKDVLRLRGGAMMQALLSERNYTFKEHTNGQLELDFDSKVVKAIIRFMHSGRMESHCGAVMLDILYAAQLYGMDELKSYCEPILIDRLQEDSSLVLQYLVAADRCHLSFLKCYALNTLLNIWSPPLQNLCSTFKSQLILLYEESTRLLKEGCSESDGACLIQQIIAHSIAKSHCSFVYC